MTSSKKKCATAGDVLPDGDPTLASIAVGARADRELVADPTLLALAAPIADARTSSGSPCKSPALAAGASSSSEPLPPKQVDGGSCAAAVEKAQTHENAVEKDSALAVGSKTPDQAVEKESPKQAKQSLDELAKETPPPKAASGSAQPAKADLETPTNKKKKLLPKGYGGHTHKADECVVCQRPREETQKGRACPTCQKIMRIKKNRSIDGVLADAELLAEIKEQSLKEKPLEDPNKDLRKTVEKLEKALSDLKRRRKM